MALYDENGRITIDEIAAQRDIDILNSVLEQLRSSLEDISQIEMQAQEFDSETNKNILEECRLLKMQISREIEASENAITYIRDTVRKYQQIDRNLRELISNTTGFGDK